MFYAFIHAVITVCISEAPKPWWAFQSSFDFRSKRGERETEQHHSRLCPRQIEWLATLIWNCFPFIVDSFINDLFLESFWVNSLFDSAPFVHILILMEISNLVGWINTHIMHYFTLYFPYYILYKLIIVIEACLPNCYFLLWIIKDTVVLWPG